MGDLDAAKFGNLPDTSRQYSALCYMRAVHTYIHTHIHTCRTALRGSRIWGRGPAARLSLPMNGRLVRNVPRQGEREEKDRGRREKKKKKKKGNPIIRLAKSNQVQISALGPSAADIGAQGCSD